MLIQRMSGYPAAVLRVVCRYCTVISRVGGLAVDVARAPAHPVVGVAGRLAAAVGESLLPVAAVEAVPVTALHSGPVIVTLLTGRRCRCYGVFLHTQFFVLLVTTQYNCSNHLALLWWLELTLIFCQLE